MPTTVLKPWCDARGGLRHGDLALWRAKRHPVSIAIARLGRSIYTHAGRIALVDDEWRHLDVRQWAGPRNLCLYDQVRRYPGLIDVYRPNPGCGRLDSSTYWAIDDALKCHYDPEKAVQYVLDYVSRPDARYGWRNLARVALLHMMVSRFLLAADTRDVGTGNGVPFCSHLQAAADRHAGVDPVPNLADRLVEPGDQARSLFYQYQFTLVP